MASRPRSAPDHAQRYGAQYRRIRRQWDAKIQASARTGDLVYCWRPDCQLPILPGSKWHLGHDDYDHSIIRGPEHEHCNTSAAAHKVNEMRRMSRHGYTSREW